MVGFIVILGARAIMFAVCLFFPRLFFGPMQIVTKKNRSLTLNLQDQSSAVGRKDLGNITIIAEETVSSRSVIEMILRGFNLKNKDVFSKSVRMMILFSFIFLQFMCF